MATVYFIWIFWIRLKGKRYPIQIQKNSLYPVGLDNLVHSALTFRDFVPRLELLTLFRDFRKNIKMCKMNYLVYFANHTWLYF